MLTSLFRCSNRHYSLFHSRPIVTRSGLRKNVSKSQHNDSTIVTNVLVAVDPDTRGAIATVTWEGESLSTASFKHHLNRTSMITSAESNFAFLGSSFDRENTAVDLSKISVKVFDMPCATVQLVKKIKATGKQAVRRYADQPGITMANVACWTLS